MPPITVVRMFALAACVFSACDTDDDTPDAGKDHHTSDAGKTEHRDAGRDASTDAGISSSAACLAVGGRCVIGPDTNCMHTGFQDCNSDGNPGGAVCCLDAVFEECDQGKTFPISAADYDQSCEQSSDCIGIGEGNGCDCLVRCQNAAINVADEAKWREDVAQTPVYAATCLCPNWAGPCCLDHRCSADRLKCQPPTNDDDAGQH